MKKSLFKIIY